MTEPADWMDTECSSVFEETKCRVCGKADIRMDDDWPEAGPTCPDCLREENDQMRAVLLKIRGELLSSEQVHTRAYGLANVVNADEILSWIEPFYETDPVLKPLPKPETFKGKPRYRVMPDQGGLAFFDEDRWVAVIGRRTVGSPAYQDEITRTCDRFIKAGLAALNGKPDTESGVDRLLALVAKTKASLDELEQLMLPR